MVWQSSHVLRSFVYRATDLQKLQQEFAQMKREADITLVENAVKHLQQLITRPSDSFDPYAAMAGLEQVVN